MQRTMCTYISNYSDAASWYVTTYGLNSAGKRLDALRMGTGYTTTIVKTRSQHAIITRQSASVRQQTAGKAHSCDRCLTSCHPTLTPTPTPTTFVKTPLTMMQAMLVELKCSQRCRWKLQLYPTKESTRGRAEQRVRELRCPTSLSFCHRKGLPQHSTTLAGMGSTKTLTERATCSQTTS